MHCALGQALPTSLSYLVTVTHHQFFREYKSALFQAQKTDQQKQLVAEKFKLAEDALNETNFTEVLSKVLNDLRHNIDPIV